MIRRSTVEEKIRASNVRMARAYLGRRALAEYDVLKQKLDDTIERGEPVTPADRAAVDRSLREALSLVWA